MEIAWALDDLHRSMHVTNICWPSPFTGPHILEEALLLKTSRLPGLSTPAISLRTVTEFHWCMVMHRHVHSMLPTLISCLSQFLQYMGSAEQSAAGQQGTR